MAVCTAMMTSLAIALLSLQSLATCQKIDQIGTSGGCGPSGGIGDSRNPVNEAQAFITDALIPSALNSTRQLTRGLEPSIVDSNFTAAKSCIWNVTVNLDGGPRQEILGFGHAWTDSAVATLNSLDEDVFEQAMQDLFGQEGNNMGLMRHTIGSSDLSYNQYSFEDNRPDFNLGNPDLNLSKFGLGNDGTRMADMIASMGNYKSDVTLFGSPWSAPGWMKRNGLFIAPELNVPNGGAYYFTNNPLNFNYIPQYIQYLTNYVDAYKSRGVNVNAITLMNEPLNNQGGYPTMYLDAVDAASIISQGLGASMQQRNVAIRAYDHNTDMPFYPQRVVEGAPGQVQGAAWHCYANPANYSVLEDFHHQNPDMPQFMTECSNYKPENNTFNFKVASAFIPPITHGASGACMWAMATDEDYGPHSPFEGCDGCSGSLIVDSSRAYGKTNDYYMIGQFSRFIRRGARNYRVSQGNYGSPLTDGQFYVAAFQNPDQSWVVIFMNNYGQDREVVVDFSSKAPAWQGLIPNATVVTWLLPAY